MKLCSLESFVSGNLLPETWGISQVQQKRSSQFSLDISIMTCRTMFLLVCFLHLYKQIFPFLAHCPPPSLHDLHSSVLASVGSWTAAGSKKLFPINIYCNSEKRVKNTFYNQNELCFSQSTYQRTLFQANPD